MARRGAGDPAAVHFALGEREFWVVSSVEAYRVIAGSWPQGEETVWELGAATGAATVLAAEAAAEVYAVEKAPEKLEKLKAAAGDRANVHVLEVDAAAERPSIPADSRADWLLVDLGGDAPPWRTMAVAERWAAALRCSRVVIRNSTLGGLASSAEPVIALTDGPEPEEAPTTPEPPLKVQETSTAVLRQRVLETVCPEVATRLVDALGTSGFRERKRLVQAIVSLGHTALQPLARLVADTSASLVARRSAADALGQLVRTTGEAEGDILRRAPIPVQWAVGRAQPSERPPAAGAIAELLAADREGTSASARLLLEMLADADEFVRFIARSHLRHGDREAAKSLAAEIAAAECTLPAVVGALDALTMWRGLSAARIVKWIVEAASPDDRHQVSRTVACACLAAADQKWAASLLSALANLPSADRGGVPADQLRALHRVAQREPASAQIRRLVHETLDAGIGAEELAAAASISPHPWMRQVGEIVSSDTSP
jgi:hypothetical protein